MSMKGVEGEEKIDLNKEEAKAVRRRSMRLLGSLIRPVRGRLAVSFRGGFRFICSWRMRRRHGAKCR